MQPGMRVHICVCVFVYEEKKSAHAHSTHICVQVWSLWNLGTGMWISTADRLPTHVSSTFPYVYARKTPRYSPAARRVSRGGGVRRSTTSEAPPQPSETPPIYRAR